MEIKVKVGDGIDCFGMYAVIDGQLYAKYGECDFKLAPGQYSTNNKDRAIISRTLLNGLEATLKSGLRVERLSYIDTKKIKE